ITINWPNHKTTKFLFQYFICYISRGCAVMYKREKYCHSLIIIPLLVCNNRIWLQMRFFIAPVRLQWKKRHVAMKGRLVSKMANVYCIGRNYRLHAAELGNAVPDEPMVFMKPTHAVSMLDGGVHTLPGTSGEVHYEAELIIRIGQQVTQGMRAEQ